jgi:amino acid adenylation domain-containing protein
MGLGRHDRIALVLPNGPEMALACVAVAAHATCVPLNPDYSASELDAYLASVRPRACIIQTGLVSPARAVAQTHGLGVIELSPVHAAEAGIFTLMGEEQPRTGLPAFARANDVAFLLHTAGTTSRPKLVPLTHTNISTAAHNLRLAFQLVESDRCLNVLPLFHVHALQTALLTSLVAGASIVCTPGFYAPQFFAWLAEFRPTWYTAVPTIHQAILARAPLHREIIARCPLRFIRSASAVLPPHVLMELEAVFHTQVIETYGATEVSGHITCQPLPSRPRKTGAVGMAAGPEVAIMDARGTLLPAGETGEVVVRGPSLMQGYDNDPTANQNAFVSGWFRTGDQGYMDAEGYLFITGRLKEIINRGGEKIAPLEVDQVLLEHPAVAAAVTFAVPHAQLGEDIAAAVVLRQDTVATASNLRQFVATRLVAFKVPSQVYIVEAIPQSPTGKLQRSTLVEQLGLTAPEQTRPERSASSSAPRTPLEEVLAGFWAQVLEVEGVGMHDNFFELGGDSMLATQLMSRVREATRIEVSFVSFFETPTVEGMARSIENANRATPSSLAPPMQPVPRDGALPLSYPQQRLWFLDQLGLSSYAYNLLQVTRLSGALHTAALSQGLQAMTRRHEVLRTTFTDVAGQLLQVVGPVALFPLPMVDLQGLPECEQEAQVCTLARAEAQRPFDLAQGPLLRATLVRLATEEHVLIMTMHHIVTDGWSHGVFWRELGVLYAAFTTGQSALLPEPALQYADFAHWQWQWLQSDHLAAPLAYWKQQLAGVPTLQMPTDRPRPAVQTFRGARYPLAFSPALTQGLKALSQRQGVTLFMTLLAAFQALLHRYSGQDDIVVGSLIANRNHIETEGLIGFFVNTLVLRTDVSCNPSFRELLGRVRQVALGAYSHQDLPYEKLLEELRPPRDLSRNPLFQVLCVLHNTPRQAPELVGLTLSPLEIDFHKARFDVTLDLSETPEGLSGWFEYSTDLFDAATIARMSGHLLTLLEGILADPEQRLATLPLLTPDECQRLLAEWNTTRTDYGCDQCLHQVFEAQVARTPDAVAVVYADEQLTYHELNRRANQVAHHLQALGVGPEVLVGLCMERSVEMVVGLLGILKAGGAYVPLDPTYPPERLAFMLADAQAPVVLTQQRLVAGLPEYRGVVVCLDAAWPTIAQHSDHDAVSGGRPDNLAYLLYTSGSMGQPKGVLGSHRATLNTLSWLWQRYPFTPQEVCCHKTSLSFVDSIQELLGPLLQGIRTVLIPHEVLQDLPRLVHLLAAHHVTRFHLVPALLRVLLDTYGDLQSRLPDLKLWCVGGESLSKALWQRFLERLPCSRLINGYGMSEASAKVAWYDTGLMHDALSSVPIGRPIANTQVYVLDRQLQPVPIGIPGELHVGGTGLSRGYHNRPELTAAHFIPHPFSGEPGARLYKTGDLVRYLPDGTLEYLGRMDHQVKIRGFRIEPGEVETALEQHPGICQAVVVAREDTPGDTRLVAYLRAAQEPVPTGSALRSFLKAKLPNHMLPATCVFLDVLPLTPTGKVDRRTLPAPNPIRPTLAAAFANPRTLTEEVLTGIWATVLGVTEVGVHDNFFDLGGHSLMAVQVMSRLRDALQVEVPVRALFEAPTVADLALYVETTRQTAPGVPEPPIRPGPRQGAVPVSVAQEHLWVLDQVLPGTPFFNMLYAMRLLGPLDVAVLEHSVNEIIRRHEVLRTTFALVDRQPVQVIAPSLSLSLTMEDLRALPATERQDEVQRLAQAEVRKPFDLEQGPLLRGLLLRLGEQEHLLCVVMHHIISDGWSLGVLTHELAVLYAAFAAGDPSPLPPLPIQYGDFARWQRQWQHSEARQAQLVYWRQQLRAPLPVLALPTRRSQGGALSFHTARQALVIPEALSAALTQLSRRAGSTLFMTLLAAFKVLLHSYTGETDLCVGTLVANRNRQETEGLIGLFTNTVILRTDLCGNPPFREVLQRVRATTLAAYANQDLPSTELVQTFDPAHAGARTALCQVMFVLQNAMQRPLHLPAQTLRFLEADQYSIGSEATATMFDIILMMRARPQGLAGACIYKAALFDPVTINQMLEEFQLLLTRIIAQPEQALSTLQRR